jgi:putative hemolysin
MEGSDLIRLGLLLVALFISAFFSGSEAAFLSIQRGTLAQLKRRGGKRAERVVRMADHPEKFLPTVLTGNNLVNTAAAALGTSVAVSFLSSNTAIIVSTVIITILLLVFAETIPKTIAAKNSARFAMGAVSLLRFAEIMLFPVVWILERLIRNVGRLFGVSGVAMVTEDEIRALIETGRESGEVEPSEAKMLEQVFRFGDCQIREVMTPRTEIVWLESGTTLGEFLGTYREHAHTRFPVYQGQVDNVLGIVSVKDIVRAIALDGLGTGDTVTSLLRPAFFVPETKLVGRLFQELRGSSYQMVVVVDEFAGVAGLVTLKQMVEEIVGRVDEEEGEEEQEFLAIDAHTYQVEGGMRIDEANEHLGLDIPEGDYETIAGFLLERMGHIPQVGERHLYHGFSVEVTGMSGVKIESLKVVRVSRPVESMPESEEDGR